MGLAAVLGEVRLESDPSEPSAAMPTMLGAGASFAAGLVEDLVEPFFSTIGAAGWAAGLEAGAVFVADEVAGGAAEIFGFELAAGTAASSLSGVESSLASPEDGWESAVVDCGEAVDVLGEDTAAGAES